MNAPFPAIDAAAAQRPLRRVMAWGTADRDKPRNRILLDALRDADFELQEVHADVWAGVADKSRLGRAARLARYLRLVLVYPKLLIQFLLAPRPDALVVGYPAQLDVSMLWPAAKLRRVPILMDLFISIYDTTVHDRALTRPGSLKARLLWGMEWLACRAADRVIIDTAAHARYVEELFDLPAGSVGHVAVGAEIAKFERLPRRAKAGRPRLLFYGQLIPLHGIETILAAACSDRGQAFDWTIIGDGQDASKVAAALGPSGPRHVHWIKWVPYAELPHWIAQSDICLGIFGTSRKAASVVPNKVFQCLASGRHVVTRASLALAELPADAGLTMVEPGSPDRLLDGIEAALAAGCPEPSSHLVNHFSADRLGSQMIRYLEGLQ
ncbi:glycosyltransferase [Sphingomonas lutea]|uniref:Glycosyltransferase n=1 Tax=Sphingomonas lutea TaxID=1045317 RepID=A0A7G9SI95_9SPHN|nr:glycosyltransferase [Sphingomonas lutea]QNN67570.1 glycosyltransferase [Sphingomonas lutea]